MFIGAGDVFFSQNRTSFEKSDYDRVAAKDIYSHK